MHPLISFFIGRSSRWAKLEMLCDIFLLHRHTTYFLSVFLVTTLTLASSSWYRNLDSRHRILILKFFHSFHRMQSIQWNWLWTIFVFQLILISNSDEFCSKNEDLENFDGRISSSNLPPSNCISFRCSPVTSVRNK